MDIKGKDCGYDYDLPPLLSNLDLITTKTTEAAMKSAMPIARISGISRAHRPGSFIIRVLAHTANGKDEVVAIEPVLSRWHVPSCADCSNSLGVTAHRVLHPDLRVEDDKRLIDFEPEDRVSAAQALQLKIEVLENPLAGISERGGAKRRSTFEVS